MHWQHQSEQATQGTNHPHQFPKSIHSHLKAQPAQGNFVTYDTRDKLRLFAASTKSMEAAYNKKQQHLLQ